MRILIADDEPLIRVSLTRSLQQLLFTDVIEAEDGLQALHFIKNDDSIQIVIADIRMPGIDGLHLLSEAKKLRNNLIFIFLSGYDFFEYAQKAVKLGAIGYLLKPFKINELKEILVQAEEELLARNKQKVMINDLKMEMEQGTHYMRKRIIFELVKENAYSESFLKSKLSQLGIHLLESYNVILYLSIDNYQILISEVPLQERELIKFSLNNIVSEKIAAFGVLTYFFELDDGLGSLLNFDEAHQLADPSTLLQMCNEIRLCVQRYTKFTITVGIGRMVNNIMQLNQSFETAEKAVTQRLLKGGNKVYSYSEIPVTEVGTSAISAKYEIDLQASFEQLNMDRAMNLIEACFATYLTANQTVTGSLMRLNFQLIILIFKNVSQAGIEPESALGNEMRLYNLVNSLSGVDKVILWFQKLVQNCFDLIHAQKEHRPNNLIVKAKEFIHRHYNQDITLEFVADSVLLSPAHFSKLFKEETGENFSNYVLLYRMNIARSLLKDGIYKANQVAEMIGFRDEKYFYKAFKRFTGFTPSEYRNAKAELRSPMG